jgi:hypothetical protein
MSIVEEERDEAIYWMELIVEGTLEAQQFWLDEYRLVAILMAIHHSPVAQLAEQMAVNHRVRGSSPCWGARSKSAR